MRIRTLIVDDEYPAREELRFHLSSFPGIEVVGEAANAAEALALIKAVDYQLVFLDINFPTSNGIEIGMEIAKTENPPLIIYVTAHEGYALKAFDVDAVDYILKPIDEKRLRRAVERVVSEYTKRSGAPAAVSLDAIDSAGLARVHAADVGKTGETSESADAADTKYLARLTAEYQGKLILVDAREIIYAYSEDNYVFIKTYDKKLISRYTLSSLAEKLDPKSFFRTHRSYLVNLDKVLEIAPSFHGTYSLIVEDQEESKIPVSRIQTKELRKLLLF